MRTHLLKAGSNARRTRKGPAKVLFLIVYIDKKLSNGYNENKKGVIIWI